MAKNKKEKVSKMVKSRKKEKVVEQKIIVVEQRIIYCVDCNKGVKISRYKEKPGIYRCADCRIKKIKSEVNDKGQYINEGNKFVGAV